MKLYRYSPIHSQESLGKAVGYVAEKSQELCAKLTAEHLEFSGVLTICSHYYEEYDVLANILTEMGTFDKEHNGPRVVLHKPFKTPYGQIARLRIRHPDPYRYQVGAGDFRVADYEQFKQAHLTDDNPYIREIIRPDLTMLEFWHPDYDVVGYIVKKE